MEPISAEKLASWAGGRFWAGKARQDLTELYVTGVSTDTRTIKPGDAFFALIGGNFDGNQFAEKAIDQGAALVVVSREDVAKICAERAPVILVEDTLRALWNVAAEYRKGFDIPVVAVTGSAGKTTTKDMIHSVMSTRLRTLKTQGNFNNEIGLPLTLLMLDRSCQAAVVEMGMRGFGQIRNLAGIAKPTAGVVTNVGDAHIELLGSRENIARAKAELVEELPDDGCAVLNADDPLVASMASRTRAKVVYYGVEGHRQGGGSSGDRPVQARSAEAGSRLQASGAQRARTEAWVTGFGLFQRQGGGTDFGIRFPDGAEVRAYVPLPGTHNVYNALAAAAVAWHLGLGAEAVAEGLSNIELSPMRMHIQSLHGATFINDAYNANPASMRAALDALVQYAAGARTIAVLGDMLELGRIAEEAHRDIGRHVRRLRVDALVTVGPLARLIAEAAVGEGMDASKVFPCGSTAEAARCLREILCAGDVVLVKGSRGVRMEQVISEMENSGPVGSDGR